MSLIIYAVIIKHPYRDTDYRVDIVKVHEDISKQQIYEKIMKEMLGPFKVISITEKIDFDREIKFSQLEIQNEPTTTLDTTT